MVRPRAAGAVDRLEDAVDEVLDVDEVAPGVHHEDALPFRQAREEGRQRAGEVARPVGVRKPEGDPVELAERDVLLAAGLRDRVARALRPDRVLERDRLLERLEAVAERGLEVDQALRAGRLGRLDDVRGPEHVRARVLFPVVRVLVRGRCVDDDVRRAGGERLRDDVLVRDRALDHKQLRVLGQVVAPPGRVVVDDDDVVTALEQDIGDVRPDEARAAGDQNSHTVTSSFSWSSLRKLSERSWNACCQSSRQRSPQARRP